jgi:two-component system, HptB-dependent secretion and biofilm response regulator
MMPKSVLVVDDHSYNRDLLGFILEDEGLQMIEAQDGDQACQLFKDNADIELVLMDVNMPVMDGLEATRKIKEIAKSELRFVAIIFVTALDNPEVLVKCLNAGGDDFVPKPINEAILLSKIQAHLRSQKLYNDLKELNKELDKHRHHMDREHRIVEHIFSNDINLSSTICENLRSYSSPASLFNGDVLLSAPSPSGGLYCLLGDFTGHGLAAAVGSLPVSSIFYDCASRHESISHMAMLINQRLIRLLPHGMFFCAAILYVDYEGQSVQAWTGGMNDILIKHKDDAVLKVFSSMHMPLGVLEEDEFDSGIELIPLPKNAKLYAFTDGVNEAKNCDGDEFGLASVYGIVMQEDGSIEKIIQAVREHVRHSEPSDDISLIELTAGRLEHISRLTHERVDIGSSYRATASFPWQLDIQLIGDDLRSHDMVLQVGKFLGSIKGVEQHQDKIFTIISELYSNALEHGVLQLSSELKKTPDGFDEYYRLRAARLAAMKNEYIHIHLEYQKGDAHKSESSRLLITIKDSGQGFDIEAVRSRAAMDTNDDSHGRGLSLLQNFCESVFYSEKGSRVTAVYRFA